MRIIKQKNPYQVSFTVFPTERYFPNFYICQDIRKYYPKEKRINQGMATINWAGCGDQSVEYTKNFANGLNLAILIAEALDKDETISIEENEKSELEVYILIGSTDLRDCRLYP